MSMHANDVYNKNRTEALHERRYDLRREWVELDDQNNRVTYDRMAEIQDEIDEIDEELGFANEVVITVRGGVAETRYRTDDAILVTIIDYDNEAENGIEDAR